MTTSFFKKLGIAILLLICFYGIQYVATVIHFACQNPMEDCPPPIYLVGEMWYRIIVQPPWLPFNR